MTKLLQGVCCVALVIACDKRSEPRPVGILGRSLRVGGGGRAPSKAAEPKLSLAEARKGFKTKIVREAERYPLDVPPANAPFELVRYDAPPGKLAAYVTKAPKDGKKHPAIVWITGGDNNSIGDVWTAAPPDNDQTAAAYREAGIVMMFPSQRGGNDNPGKREGFLGEVEDVLAAADYLAAQPHVDKDRVYLGGHSTGGTLVLLVAEASDRFRAVFSFGPVADIRFYGPDFIFCDPDESQGIELRSPVYWLDSVRSPLFVLEGTDGGNADQLKLMRKQTDNPQVHFYEVAGVDHFAILAPVNALLAQKIMAGEPISVGRDEVQRLFR